MDIKPMMMNFDLSVSERFIYYVNFLMMWFLLKIMAISQGK